jgi:hypothetical protein
MRTSCPTPPGRRTSACGTSTANRARSCSSASSAATSRMGRPLLARLARVVEGRACAIPCWTAATTRGSPLGFDYLAPPAPRGPSSRSPGSSGGSAHVLRRTPRPTRARRFPPKRPRSQPDTPQRVATGRTADRYIPRREARAPSAVQGAVPQRGSQRRRPTRSPQKARARCRGRRAAAERGRPARVGGSRGARAPVSFRTPARRARGRAAHVRAQGSAPLR